MNTIPKSWTFLGRQRHFETTRQLTDKIDVVKNGERLETSGRTFSDERGHLQDDQRHGVPAFKGGQSLQSSRGRSGIM